MDNKLKEIYSKKIQSILEGLGNNKVQDILDEMGMIDENGYCPYTAEEIFTAGVEWTFGKIFGWMLDDVDFSKGYEFKGIAEPREAKGTLKKLIDGIEKPKFKEGDWIVFNGLVLLIEEVVQGYYRTISIGGVPNSYDWDIDNAARLWVIQDVKDGDVLTCYSNRKGKPIKQTGIFKQYVGKHGGCSNCFLAHMGIDWDGNIKTDVYMGSADIFPATKKQYDLLFQKIKEEGYMWDADKKEPKKVGQKFNVGDWIVSPNNLVSKITYVSSHSYTLHLCNNDYRIFETESWYIDKEYRLWSIEDAKIGDILAIDWVEGSVKWQKIVLFISLNKNGVEGYGNTFKNNKLAFKEDVPYYSKTWTNRLHPATIEQRNLLFQKMEEEGWRFNTEKKQLVKIENYE